MDRLHFPFELKLASSGAAGMIEGYGSVFHNVDSYGDVVAPGAFAKSLGDRKSSGRGMPSMFMQHGAALGADPRPVGVWDSVDEDSKGLRVTGRLSGLDTDTGRYNLALVRDGAMRGLSIGFRVPKGGATYGNGAGQPHRTLTAIDLHEISLVSDPANAAARVDSLKARAEGIKTARQFEELLAEAGFSHAAARKLAAGGWSALNDVQDEADVAALVRRITHAATELKGTAHAGLG